MTNSTSKLLFSVALLLFTSAFAPKSSEARPPAKARGLHSYNISMQSRGRLGAAVMPISKELRRHFGAPADAGLLVDRVISDTPAAKAGLQSGDVIVSVAGKSIAENWDIFRALKDAKTGDKINIDIVRGKKKRSLSATLDDKGGMAMQWGNTPHGDKFDFDFDFDPSSLLEKGMADHFGKAFPFHRRAGEPLGESALQEKVRRLEERLNKLEGTTSGKKGKGKGKKIEKPLRAPAGSGKGVSS